MNGPRKLEETFTGRAWQLTCNSSLRRQRRDLRALVKCIGWFLPSASDSYMHAHVCHVNPHTRKYADMLTHKMDNIFLKDRQHCIESKQKSGVDQLRRCRWLQMTRAFILDMRSLVRLQENDLPSNPNYRSEPSVDKQELWGDIRRWGKQALRMRILQMLRGPLGIVEQQSGQQTLSYGNTIALTHLSVPQTQMLLTHTVLPLLGFPRCHHTIVT